MTRPKEEALYPEDTIDLADVLRINDRRAFGIINELNIEGWIFRDHPTPPISTDRPEAIAALAVTATLTARQACSALPRMEAKGWMLARRRLTPARMGTNAEPT